MHGLHFVSYILFDIAYLIVMKDILDLFEEAGYVLNETSETQLLTV